MKMKKIMCLVLCAAFVFLCSCGGNGGEQETTTEEVTAEETVTEEPSVLPTESEMTTEPETETAAPETAASATDAPVTEKMTEKVTEKVTRAETTEANDSVENLSKAQITEKLKTAINKTKGYKGKITVHHKESFADLQISNVSPGGEMSSKLMNFVTGLVIKPSEEDYSFSNGSAVTSEGEKTQLLLPKDAAFTLSDSGVKSASIEKKNGMTHITVTLVSESCNSLTDKPEHNASAIGYLDISGSFKLMKITSIKIDYPGSVIDAYIRDDGYVSSVTYTVNMDCHGEASYGLINGKADFKGAQTETWTLKW